MLTASAIRKKYLDFFVSKGHTPVRSDSLVPKNDPTVLFTTAGMQQFKRQFLGHIEGYTRATSSQKCLRTDDLDQVGKTNFHHTFFEMLGNFSFGDYFKNEAITWAWEFLTGVVNLPPEKLWVSVHKDDEEAAAIWLNTVKIPPRQLVRLGDKSNFWPSNARTDGPNGPCGPCSEIFYDYGQNPKCSHPHCNPDCDCGRFAEIWNLVFTQFERKDGGILEPLPAKNIDTGMGLERLTAVIQGKKNNFDTDLFAGIRQAIRRLIPVELSWEEECVVADHIRAIVFAICDGIIPSNKERGSVVKRLINDSANIALSYGPQHPCIYQLVPDVIRAMQDQYPELADKSADISDFVKKTEEAFIQVRAQRIPELESLNLTAMSSQERGTTYFKFRDTYGLPLSVILTTARKKGIPEQTLCQDLEVYKHHMTEQQCRSRAASKMAGDVFTDTELNLNVCKTRFLGYEHHTAEARILKLFVNTEERATVQEGEDVQCVLDATPFYAESGGQVGDTGIIQGPSGQIRVTNTHKISDIFIHNGQVERGCLKGNESVTAQIDSRRRLAIMRNHTATHLLQAGLREILGQHVQQQGSLVDEKHLRFDFSHPKALSANDIRALETYVNDRILSCGVVSKESMRLDQAKDKGALAFFAEKYSDTVRVVAIDDFSIELCGGTHLDSTGQIGVFKIVSESAIAQGIRRIEAKTGTGALELINEREDMLQRLSQFMKSPVAELDSRAALQAQRMKQMEKDLEKFQTEAVLKELPQILAEMRDLNGTRVIRHTLEGVTSNVLRKLADAIKQQVDAIVILASRGKNDVQVLVSVGPALIKAGWNAKNIIQIIAEKIQGNGGGREAMAQAGSPNPDLLPDALGQAENYIKQRDATA
ncbi:MAG TPA: alanine--tRNA ligase [Candidatus Omnitrophota bacterium]|nr:alanine--tRNA ligase [Candidatus Omnitrophota bacterium]HQO58080.1 alanine--tRNA ligase [Candidatus Omnitrophota bacterium]